MDIENDRVSKSEDILETIHKSASTTKQSKMKTLINRFESMRTKESNTIREFYAKRYNFSSAEIRKVMN
ncbi:hypothetical protein J1N35_024600 [Gossypium stocksii]|uniref:Uncharacterized protein n=1 Tax=Gossypium stocksii TaxID=47602 RepID=A0A9D3ZWF5_9ROSI|nr:hypothetical protein J1N35_024600 [Gossypium stocksii]